MNSVQLVGRLVADPELRTTNAAGIPVANFRVAINRGKDKPADFIPVIAWEKEAENVAKYMKKGERVGVEGRLQTRNYEVDGQKRFAMEVVARHVEFLEPKHNGPSDAVEVPEDIPF